MSPDIVAILWLCIPAVCGGIVALLNSGRVNDITEKVEAWTRRRRGILSVKKDFSTKWIVRPPVGMIVKLCDWTDSLAHRGVKNGIRIAAAIYVLGFWLLLLLYAFMMALALVLALIFAVIGVIFVLWMINEVLGGKSKSKLPNLPNLRGFKAKEQKSDEEYLLAAAGKKGQKTYAGTNWVNEELKGRVDENGNVYSGTNWVNEEKIGKIDKEGNIFRGTTWLNEELVGRIDSEGNIQKGTNWFNEEKIGRIDPAGNVFKGTNWLNERKTGRSGD